MSCPRSRSSEASQNMTTQVIKITQPGIYTEVLDSDVTSSAPDSRQRICRWSTSVTKKRSKAVCRIVLNLVDSRDARLIAQCKKSCRTLPRPLPLPSLAEERRLLLTAVVTKRLPGARRAGVDSSSLQLVAYSRLARRPPRVHRIKGCAHAAAARLN